MNFIYQHFNVEIFSSINISYFHSLCEYYNKSNLKDIIQLLIDRGADVNSENENRCTPLHAMCNHYKKLDVKHLIEVVKLLIESGAKLNVRDDNEKTPLHYLWPHAKYEDKEDKENVELVRLVNFILEKGGEV